MTVVTHLDDGRAARYIREAIISYLGDPPDSDFQQGYLAALLDLYREGLGKGSDDDRIKLAAKMVYP